MPVQLDPLSTDLESLKARVFDGKGWNKAFVEGALIHDLWAEVERLRAGLQSIAEFNCHPYIECDPKAVAESDACPECQEARKPERRWPPSGHCDTHYRTVLVARDQKQAHEELTVKYRMKDIAVAVLRGEALPALRESQS
jgi:hypothetical protein